MITQIDISGFRSIKEASIPLKKLNILYGQNGSGKSSVMYAPYVFRNFCVNPNQRMNRFFDLDFMNLGGFEEVRNNSFKNTKIGITKSISLPSNYALLAYNFEIRNNERGSIMHYYLNEILQASVLVELPYSSANKVEVEYNSTKLIWDGVLFQNFVGTQQVINFCKA